MPLLARSGPVAPRILASVIVLLGIVMIARTITAGGGPLSVGVVLGVAFVAVGIGRLYLALRASR
jgi:hypothetical protein